MADLSTESYEIGNYKVDVQIKTFAAGEAVPQHMREKKENPIDTTIKPGERRFVVGVTRVSVNTAVAGRTPVWQDMAELDIAQMLVVVPQLQAQIALQQEENEKLLNENRGLKAANTKLKTAQGKK